AEVNTLHPRTRELLASIAEPVDALVIYAGEPGFEVVYREVDRILHRMRDAQPLLRLDRVDPALEPQRVEALADAAALSAEVLRGRAAVVFCQGGRQRVLELPDLAEFATDELGAGGVARPRAEEAFAEAVRGVTAAPQPRLCVPE